MTLFHCSDLPTLMTNGRSKTDPLGETTKSLVRDIWIRETFGREKTDSINKYTQKGIMVESDSLELASQILGKSLFKNDEQFSNSFITGTPDNIDRGVVRDIKSSYDLWTFASVNEEKARKDYFYQMLGYMWLTGKKKAQLIYTLVNTPEHLIVDELYKLSFKVGETDQYKKNYVFDDIPAEKRVKIFNFEFSREEIEAVKQRIRDSRNYMKTLSL